MKVEDRIAKARIGLLLNHPFLGTLALNLRVKDGDSIGCQTMGTDGRSLFYNREFVKKLTDDELVGVIAHELGHVIYQHVLEWRRASTKEYPEIFTMAQEYVVNDMVMNMFGLKLPGKPFLDKDYFGMYTEQVYCELLKKLKPQKSQSYAAMVERGMVDQHGLGQPGAGEGEGGEDGKGGGKGITPSEHGTTPNLAKELDQLSKDIKLQIAQAANAARMRGKLPAGLERIIDDVLETKIPWRAMLAEFLCGTAHDDFSWKVPNRRHLYRGVILPALRSESIELAICIDTSGSIDKETLSDFWGEIRAIMAAFPSYKLHLMGCDAQVHSYQAVAPWDEVDIDSLLKGGGGTSLVPALLKIEEEGLTPRALLYLTDGYSEFGDEPPYPVLHVIKGGFEDVPWGRVVHLD